MDAQAPPYAAFYSRPSTSQTSLEDLEREDAARRRREQETGSGGHDKKGAQGGQRRPTALDSVDSAPIRLSVKGKEPQVEVQLAIIGSDGVKREVHRSAEPAMHSPAPFEQPGQPSGSSRASTSEASEAEEQRDSHGAVDGEPPPDGPPSPAFSSSASTPPPSLPPHSKPTRPPLQSILKRPDLARTSSSIPSQLLPLSTLSPLSSVDGTTPALTPSAFLQPPSPASPDSLESKDRHQTVLFSTPGTTASTVLALSASSDAQSSTAPGANTGGIDPTSTFKSWKSSVLGRRSGNFDKKRLAALGFEEELSRDYDFFASWGISICNIGALPGTTLGVLTAFRTGGGSMYAIAWPISGLFMIGAASLLGEFASTWPVAGASFTWVFRLCRSRRSLNPWARYASWLIGSALLCSHLLLQIVVTWQFAHNLLGVITMFTGEHYSNWVTLAICWCICFVCGGVVSSRLSRSPWLWRVCGGLIVVFFLTINITLLVHAEQIRPASFVFRSYNNETGFESRSYVYMIGWVLTCVATGMEASAHMAEDTKKPSRTVPLAMFWSTTASYLMGWVSICVLLATMNIEGLDPSLQPSIALISNSMPRAYATLILVFVLLSFLFQCIAQLLATSRFIFALSREQALPFSNFFRRLSKKNRQPSAAIWVTLAIAFPTLILLVIDTSIISTTVLEGAGITAVTSYVTPILLYLFCPKDVLRGDGRAQWTLRGASKFVAVPVCAFFLTFMITMCLPTGYPITPLTVSYASVVFVGVLLLSSTSWVFYGNAHYAGPIKATTRWTIGAEIDLPSTSSNGATQQKKKTTVANNGGGHVTTSANHGRSAHVWAQSGADSEYSRQMDRGDETRATGAGTEMTGVTTGRTSGMTSGMTGSEYSEYTDDDEGSYDESDEDEDEDEEGARTRSAVDEERSVDTRRRRRSRDA
ncbi:hypothetical protein JCM10207_005357 [Rhodosporidiobolus poonsookiae]